MESDPRYTIAPFVIEMPKKRASEKQNAKALQRAALKELRRFNAVARRLMKDAQKQLTTGRR